MLCVISDLHLTDGTSGETITADAFRLFAECLKDSIRDACLRKDGTYQPIKRCDLLLLGDIFDVIRSDKWLSYPPNIRPWGNIDDIAPVIKSITEGIIKRNSDSLKHIKDLTNGKGEVRITDPSGSFTADIPLYIHYMVGNHDWFYHINSSTYEPIRKMVVDAWGLSNKSIEPFPHTLKESTSSAKNIASILNTHKVYAQHGDIYDKFNFEKEHGREYSSLGDCLVVELLDCFPKIVQNRLLLDPNHELLKTLREIDNVRPTLSVPAWLKGKLSRFRNFEEIITKIWDSMVDDFLQIEFVKQHDKFLRWDSIDTLAAGLKISKSPLRVLTSMQSIFAKCEAKFSHDYAREAVEEKALREDTNYVVYGHTHDPKTVFLDLVESKREFTEKIYFNSGTWRRAHQAAIVDPTEFASFHVMTYVLFYSDGERKGRRYETWNGQLG